MRLTLPLKFEIQAKATSTFDAETIERRLAVLRQRSDQEAIDEISFLEDLKAKMKPDTDK